MARTYIEPEILNDVYAYMSHGISFGDAIKMTACRHQIAEIDLHDAFDRNEREYINDNPHLADAGC